MPAPVNIICRFLCVATMAAAIAPCRGVFAGDILLDVSEGNILVTTTQVFSAEADRTSSGHVVALGGSKLTAGFRHGESGEWTWRVLDEEPNYAGEVALLAEGPLVVVARPVGILIRIYRSTDGGRTFTGPCNMTLNDPGVTAPVREMAITRHPSGTCLIAFTRDHEGSPTLGYVMTSSDDGASWSAPRLAFGGQSSLSQLSLGANSDGYFLSFVERTDDFAALYLGRSADGIDWLDEVLSRRSGSTIGASALLVREGDSILALDSKEGGNIVFWRRQGTSWNASTLPLEDRTPARSLLLSTFPDGRIMLFRDKAEEGLELMASADAGQTWAQIGALGPRKGRIVAAFPADGHLQWLWRKPGALVNDGRLVWKRADWSPAAATMIARMPGTKLGDAHMAVIPADTSTPAHVD